MDETRKEALKLAIAFCGSEPRNLEYLLIVAEKFFNFLRGKND